MRMTLSSSTTNVTAQTGFNFLLNRFISGWLSLAVTDAGLGYGYMTGFLPIEVTDSSATLHLWFENCDPTTGDPPSAIVTDNGENYIFAVPAY